MPFSPYANKYVIQQQKKEHKTQKKTNMPDYISNKQAKYQRLVRLFKEQILKFRDTDLPLHEDISIDDMMAYDDICAVILEMREHKKTHSSKDSTIALLQKCPKPQRLSQLYIGRSLFKKDLPSIYESSGQDITISPCTNIQATYFGKIKTKTNELGEETTDCEAPITKLVFTEKMDCSPNKEFTLITNLEALPRLDVNLERLYSLYSTRPPTQSKAEIVIPKEITVKKSHVVDILPASQGPLTNDMLEICKTIFGAKQCERLTKRSENCGGHPNLDAIRSLAQCSLDSRYWTTILSRLTSGENFMVVEIGSKYGAMESQTNKILTKAFENRLEKKDDYKKWQDEWEYD